MRVFIILSILIGAAIAFPKSEEWESFKITHSKTYEDHQEEQYRFRVFNENLQKIAAHNKKYENGETTYYLAVTQFTDMTAKEFKHLLDSQSISMPKPHVTSRFVADPQANIPDAMDWRDKGAVTPVRNQGEPLSCGSCWAHSAAGALESHRFLKENILEVLSVQQLVSCTPKYGNYGCAGGWFENSFKYVAENGICTEKSYPYKAINGTCEECQPIPTKFTGYKMLDKTDASLLQVLGTIGPVSVTVHANDLWRFYGGGVLDVQAEDDCSPDELNHQILTIGYGHDKSLDKDYWIVKNSWGKNWGEKGYIRISRGKNVCGINEEAGYPLV